MKTPGGQSLSTLVARQPKFHFWLMSSLGVVVLASSFLSHDKRGLLYYDEPTALLADDLAMMPEYITGGFGVRLATGRDGLGDRPNRLLRTIAPRGTEPTAAGSAGGAPGAGNAPSTPNFIAPTGPALASGPAAGGSSPGLPAFGSSGGFAPTPIGFVPTPADGSSSSSGGSSGGDGGTSGGGTSGGDGGSTSGGSSSGGGTPGPVVPAVPEPASWLMMIIAVFTLGSAIRRGSANRDALATC